MNCTLAQCAIDAPVDNYDEAGQPWHEECQWIECRAEAAYWSFLAPPSLPANTSSADAYERGHYKASA